jgi:lipopolysaccharide transport system ATP-binding protein
MQAGRKPGNEDTQAHERKGIAGDWRNYFTDRVSTEFKRCYGSLLVATGYEKGFSW